MSSEEAQNTQFFVLESQQFTNHTDYQNTAYLDV